VCVMMVRTGGEVVRVVPAHSMQVVVDANMRFMYVGGGLPGTVYDGHSWGRTSFGRRLAAGELLPEGYYVIVDGGYVVRFGFALNHCAGSQSASPNHFQGDVHMLTPFTKPKNADLHPTERRFNYLHSLTRGAVERALGLLKARFRWMLRGVQFRNAETYVLWFVVCCILHNMCIDAGVDPDVVDADVSDASYGGLAARSDFVLAVRKALQRRTQEALEQAEYGTGSGRRRRKVPVGAAGAAAEADSNNDEDVPDATGEEDTPPPVEGTQRASDVMLDTNEGKLLRRVVFEGLHIAEEMARKKPRLEPGPLSASGQGRL
jgi:hypothetical protein